jgi:hypothetical protein
MIPTTWRPVTRPPRQRVVICEVCRRSTINETNLLRREGWTESAQVPRIYRCGECAAAKQ